MIWSPPSSAISKYTRSYPEQSQTNIFCLNLQKYKWLFSHIIVIPQQQQTNKVSTSYNTRLFFNCGSNSCSQCQMHCLSIAKLPTYQLGLHITDARPTHTQLTTICVLDVELCATAAQMQLHFSALHVC